MSFALITLDDTHGLACCIADKMNKQLHVAQIKKFADGEISVGVDNPSDWVGNKAVIIQSTSAPVHEHILQLSFLAHELKNIGASQVIAVVPYFGYARQEVSVTTEKPGNAQVIAQLFEVAGIDEIITVELHKEVVASFFSIPVHNIQLHETIARCIADVIGTDVCIVAPDKGAQERAHAIATQLACNYVVLRKERFGPDQTRIVGSEGVCGAPAAVVVDDIIDTAGTALHAVANMHEKGIQKIYGFFVHPVFSGDALERVQASVLRNVFVTNTIPLPASKSHDKIKVIDISTQLANAIWHVIDKK